MCELSLTVPAACMPIKIRIRMKMKMKMKTGVLRFYLDGNGVCALDGSKPFGVVRRRLEGIPSKQLHQTPFHSCKSLSIDRRPLPITIQYVPFRVGKVWVREQR